MSKHILTFQNASEGPGIIAQKKGDKRNRRTCGHQRVWMDEDRRMIQCRDCKVFMEPYDWIVLMVQWQSWKFSRLEDTQRQIDELMNKLLELRSEEKSTRERISRMVRKNGVSEGKEGAAVLRRTEWRNHCAQKRERKNA